MSSDYIPGNGMRGVAPEPLPNEPAVERPSSSSPVLMIAAPTPAKPKFGTLFWLSHMMGLDTYGPTTLSYAARVDMNAAALVLGSIFLFDLGAWCLLFYFIVNSGSMEFSPGRILFAIDGILPAMALFLYERSFMTADTKSHGWRRLLLPTAIRLGVIVGAAWITAQPVEMLTFSQRIKDRVQQELIRKNIVNNYREMKEAQAKQGNAAGAGQEVEDIINRDRNNAKTRLEQARQQYDETNIKLNNATNNEKAASNKVRALTGGRSNLQVDDPNTDPAVKTAIGNRDRLRAEVSRLTDDLKRFEAEQKRAQEDLDRAEQRLPPAISKKNADVAQEGLEQWVKTLQNLAPGQSPPPQGNYKFTFVDYDFLDKFRIIDDVLSGRPPRWPGADQKMIADLKHQYGMFDLTDTEIDVQSQSPSTENASQKIGIDPAAQERSQAEIRNAKRMYWAIFGVAAIIPLLSLLFKLIMPSHLSYYYSSEWQAQQGNPWAIAMVAAIASMEDHRASRKVGRLSSDIAGLPKHNGNFPSEWSKRN